VQHVNLLVGHDAESPGVAGDEWRMMRQPILLELVA